MEFLHLTQKNSVYLEEHPTVNTNRFIYQLCIQDQGSELI